MTKEKKDLCAATKALVDMMAALRNPDGGCPWDLEQDFKTIAPYTIEEAYEVAEAIERGDMDELKDELGDLLLQVIYHTQMASEEGLFDFADVADHVTQKMIHRHPHVFGDEKAHSAGDVENRIWEERKDKEKKRQNLESVVDDVPLALPALKRAQKIQKRMARVGFEWDDVGGVLDKMEEELAEMREAIESGNREEMNDELGDLFFVLTNFGRMLGMECEEALQGTNRKVVNRFKGIERELKALDIKFEEASLEQMEAIWQQQKILEKAKKAS